MHCQQAFEDDRVGRYAAAELSDAERDAFEEHFLDCGPCRRALEAHFDLVQALRARRPAPVSAAPSRVRFLPLYSARWSGLAAAASIVFASLAWFGGRYSADQRFAEERAALEGSSRQLEEQLSQTRSEQERLQAELARERELHTAPAKTATDAPLVSSFALSPGEERGEGASTPLSLAAAAGEVRFELDLATVRTYPAFRAELRGPRGDLIWSGARLRAQGREGERVLVVRVPSGVLREGDHELLLLGMAAGGKVENAASYPFTLQRR